MTTASTIGASSPRTKLEIPLVSILIPAYNTEKWIAQSIASALGQTYPRIEVLVYDDGSTDGTPERIRQFGDRVKLIQGHHAGANRGRNVLTIQAQGEWLQYLDADDYLLPGKVADQIDFLRGKEWQYDVIYSPTIIRSESTGIESAMRIQPPFDPTVQFVRWSPFCTHGMLLRRESVLNAGGWREEQPVCQEHELLLRLITGNCRLGVWNTPGTVYRFHSSATVSKSNPLRTMQVRMEILERLEEWLVQSGGMTPLHRREIYAARLDTARLAWGIDERQGELLAGKAAAHGHHWIHGHAALPLSFQFLNRVAGFRATQQIARLLRGRSQRSNS